MPISVNEPFNPKKYIYVKGAKVHNLKNIDVTIPHNKLVVITGLSGSGKSSLAFDTLFAEGQRRYVESLSSYARQFLGKLEKPAVDHIYGIAPAIAIEQKVNTVNKRSTVGTSTEIYDYLKLLFARIGKTYSPISGKEVKRDTTESIAEYINALQNGVNVILLAEIEIKNNNIKEHLNLLLKQGFTRIWLDNKIERLDKIDSTKIDTNKLNLLIDRFIIDNNDDNISRIYDSVETAFFEGNGACEVIIIDGEKIQSKSFSNRFEADGMEFQEPDVHFFSFNNPIGACKTCEGYGSVIGIDENLVIPNKNLSIYEDAIVCWKGEKMQVWKNELLMHAMEFNFPIHKPFYELSDEQKQLVWKGNKFFKGLNKFFKMVEDKSYKIQYRVMLSRYRGKTICNDCRGTRLRKDANYVKIDGKSITDFVLMPVHQMEQLFVTLKLNKHDVEIANRLVTEITNRLKYLTKVGLGYLTLNRLSSTLSGGESQRINLATSLGSSLVGSMYILDEPSIGLHSKDTEKLIGVLKDLQNLGNTVIVVEHDEDIIKAADEIIDLGPEAGRLGGEIVFQGNFNELKTNGKSLTAKYINGQERIEIPAKRRLWKKRISIKGARENNLKGIDVEFPLHTLTVVTGVSGSGKSSLVKNCLLSSLKKMFEGYSEQSGLIDKIEGDIDSIKGVEFINQNPIGKSSRSNPVTYVKAYDEIRNLFASQLLAKTRGYQPAHFSFNVDGGRCDICKGEGEITVEMQFMADIHLTCEECKGKRFKEEVLEIKIKEKNIADVLELTIDESIEFFVQFNGNNEQRIIHKLLPLQEVGLGYVQLGQSSNTLSGGEAQRVKLASFLSKKESDAHLLFIFDEPTTGLHFHDIKKLLKALNALIAQGHSVIVVEHNLDVVKSADWVIDLGPEGGINGGELIFNGTPEDLIHCKSSSTGKYLEEKM
ncbi:MAG: excinuclease ABC subunit A [Flavobacteriales bacterium CG_4_9_14_3_um_filter_32_8]|nr:MAG: excinuclease ABC subunit A [Flavobacteriales bacterium CG_4_9_14_3_um_filter_32_8]